MRAFVSFSLVMLFTASLFAPSTQAQNSDYHERLYYLCKVWGHAKYYHTEIAAGHVNWDEALLQAIDSVKNSSSNAAFNGALLLMLDSAGTMGSPTGSLPQVVDSLNNNSDQNWMHDAILDPQVSAILDTITARFRPQDHALVDQAFTDGNSTFTEDNYLHNWAFYPEEKQRLLSMFRYWNIIHYFFPYKNIMDQHWDSTLVDFIPRIVEAADGLEFHIAMRQYTAKIDDSHAFISSTPLGEWYGLYYPPFRARYIEDEVVVTQVLADVTDVEPGDIIEAIDGFDVPQLLDSLLNYVHGSNNDWKKFRAIDMMLKGSVGSFAMTIENRHGEKVDVTLTRAAANATLLHNATIGQPAWFIDSTFTSCQVGVIDMTLLKTNKVDEMFTELSSTDALVFDVRGYPQGTLWYIVDYLYSGPIHVASFTVPDIRYPGTFYWKDTYIGNGSNDPYAGKIAILFDERTLSQAEYTCMGLEQFPGAIKVGSTTAAADGNVSWMYLPGKISTAATFLGTYYPDHSPTQRVGIVPDHQIRPSIEGIRAGQDEVLEYAIAMLGCDTATGIETGSIPGKSVLFPNPVSSHLYLKETELPVSYRVMDTQGRIWIDSPAQRIQTGIDVSTLEPGAYLIEIWDGKQRWTQRVIKQ